MSTADGIEYAAETSTDLPRFLARWEALVDAKSNPFHHPAWLRAWYASFGRSDGREPLLVALREHPDGPDRLLLPLCRRRRAGLWLVEFADGGVTDYVAPLLHRDWRHGQHAAGHPEAVWRALRVALRGNDVLHLDKLLGSALEEDGGYPNPLLAGVPSRLSQMFGNHFTVDGDWLDWRRTLAKDVRKEIERCWRVFERSAAARFQRADGLTEALPLFDTLEAQQSQRMHAMGVTYALDAPAARAFYRQLLREGLADGSVVLTALRDGDAVVSALFGIANAGRYIGLRQSLGGDAWRNCSPARLLDEGTARHMREQGRRELDFGIGEYHHKEVLKMRQRPLHEICVALSLRGAPWVASWRLRRWARSRPALRAAWRRWRRLPA